MSDIWSKRKRSVIMSRIRSSGNKNTELRLIAILRASGVTGWRRHQKLPGKPDFIFRKWRIAVFVDGCFWHACPMHGTKPKSNVAFWTRKLAANKSRDKRVNRKLRAAGWHVIRIWEHDLVARPDYCINRITRTLRER